MEDISRCFSEGKTAVMGLHSHNYKLYFKPKCSGYWYLTRYKTVSARTVSCWLLGGRVKSNTDLLPETK